MKMQKQLKMGKMKKNKENKVWDMHFFPN